MPTSVKTMPAAARRATLALLLGLPVAAGCGELQVSGDRSVLQWDVARLRQSFTPGVTTRAEVERAFGSACPDDSARVLPLDAPRGATGCSYWFHRGTVRNCPPGSPIALFCTGRTETLEERRIRFAFAPSGRLWFHEGMSVEEIRALRPTSP